MWRSAGRAAYRCRGRSAIAHARHAEQRQREQRQAVRFWNRGVATTFCALRRRAERAAAMIATGAPIEVDAADRRRSRERSIEDELEVHRAEQHRIVLWIAVAAAVTGVMLTI